MLIMKTHGIKYMEGFLVSMNLVADRRIGLFIKLDIKDAYC